MGMKLRAVGMIMTVRVFCRLGSPSGQGAATGGDGGRWMISKVRGD
jgi:hypothetical protein